jgi:hypothetical protein
VPKSLPWTHTSQKKDKTGWHVQAEEGKRANPPIRIFFFWREATDQMIYKQHSPNGSTYLNSKKINLGLCI